MSPRVLAPLLLTLLASTPANANIVTYRFVGGVLEVPEQLSGLITGPNPLVFTLVVNTGIPADQQFTGNFPQDQSATYTSAVISSTVELGGTVIATSNGGTATRYRQFQELGSARDVFSYVITDPTDFTSGPVLGLTPTSLNFVFRAYSSNAFAGLDLPDPFPNSGFTDREIRLTFGAPAIQPIYGALASVSTTSVVPLPAAGWLLGTALMGLLKTRRVEGRT